MTFKSTVRRRPGRLLALALAITTALPPTLPIAASPAMEKLLFVLKSKGSLSQDEYDMLVAAMRADEKESSSKAAPAAAATGPAFSTSAGASALDKRLTQTETKIDHLESMFSQTKGQVEEISKITDNTSPTTMSVAELDTLLADKWYERLKLRGYLQVRADSVMHESGGPLHVQNDPFANDQASIGIRRGRLTYAGDLTSHVYLYSQIDVFGSLGGVPAGSSTNVVQARDFYADVSLDSAREHRIRMGLSKVPYGFSIMQSSQNRLALERPEAISTAVEGERDFGAYYMWAPYVIRERFKNIVKMGLRGSGDYGLIAFGAYSGQGINRPDLNGQPHWVARATYPFEFDNGQFFEIGVQGYAGRFVPTTAAIPGVGTPTYGHGGVNGRGIADTRAGISAILYPQPFGFESEWNWGKGPKLSSDMTRINASALSGGYFQANYRHVFASQKELIPFVRWQTYDGGRKFATNAPSDKVQEVGVGLRYIPYPELELTAMFMHGVRTNTNLAPYNQVNYDYLGLQAQINF